jgi:hypothetical protein
VKDPGLPEEADRERPLLARIPGGGVTHQALKAKAGCPGTAYKIIGGIVT